jgi:hypothetical protein
MRVSGLGWLLKISLTNSLYSQRKFYLAVTHYKIENSFLIFHASLATRRGYF